MKKYILGIATILLVLGSVEARAHMLWLTPSDPAPRPGETITLTIGFGHHFLPEEVMEKEGRLERVYAVAPDGREMDLQPTTPSTCTFTPEMEGPYQFYAVMKSGFLSTTPDGRKMGNRKTLSGVVSCFAFQLSAMTGITCGPADMDVGKGLLDLEIIPVNDPASIKKGDTLPLRVLFRGKPLQGAQLTALDARSERDKDHSWDQEVETDADGIADIQIRTEGAWLFSVRHTIPYTDQDVCDDDMFNTTLTLDFR